MWLRKFVYIQVERGKFSARVINTASTVSLNCDGLSHPRTLAGDFSKIQSSFAKALKEILPRITLRKPYVLVHLLPTFEGGYTNVELRAFKEAAEALGAIVFLLGNSHGPLTDYQIRAVTDYIDPLA